MVNETIVVTDLGRGFAATFRLFEDGRTRIGESEHILLGIDHLGGQQSILLQAVLLPRLLGVLSFLPEKYQRLRICKRRDPQVSNKTPIAVRVQIEK